MLVDNGKRWWNYTNAAFLSSHRHNLSSKLKLRNNQAVGTSTCVCNNNTIFQKEPCLGDACQSGNMTDDTVEFIISRIFNYRVNYYDSIVKWCSGVAHNWSISLDMMKNEMCLNVGLLTTSDPPAPSSSNCSGPRLLPLQFVVLFQMGDNSVFFF